MAKVKKIPQRMCVGCNEMKEKRDLIRIVKSPEGQIFVDRTGKKSGRGAYICPNKNCLEKAFKQKGLERSFKEKMGENVHLSLKKELLGEENGG
ncbi:MAG: YlxR family protein [Bacillota bacterium]|nr:YlxR family protein [Bacillota bacterium]